MSLIKCKECGFDVSSKAKTCPKCGAEFPSKIWVWGKIIGMVFLSVITVWSYNAYIEANFQENKLTLDGVPEVGWSYGERMDKMRGSVSKWASMESINTVNFDLPNQGSQNGSIHVDKESMLFYLKKGQLSCHRKCEILAKFDDGEPEYFDAEEFGDESKTINIASPKFMSNLYKSKKLTIRVKVYKNGYPDFDFYVSGLDNKRL